MKMVVEMVVMEMRADYEGRAVEVRSGPRAVGVTRPVVARAVIAGTIVRAVGIVWVNRLLTGRGAGQQGNRCEDPTSTHAFDMARARCADKIARPLTSKRDPR